MGICSYRWRLKQVQLQMLELSMRIDNCSISFVSKSWLYFISSGANWKAEVMAFHQHTKLEVCCLCHLSWQTGTFFFSIASVTFTLLLPLGGTEILTLHYKKNEQQNEAHCSIQAYLGLFLFLRKKIEIWIFAAHKDFTFWFLFPPISK